MPLERLETKRPAGSCADQTPWLAEAAHSSGRPFVQWPDTGIQPALIPAAAEQRRAKSGAQSWFNS
jgi:hypothetical protein